MEDIRLGLQVDGNISKVEYLNLIRKKDYRFEFKNGKPTVTFVFVKKGKMEYRFSNKSIIVDSGKVLLVPKNLPYKTVYLEDGTTIEAVTFDFVSEVELHCISNPMLIDSSEFTRVFESVNENNMRNTFFLLAKAYELIYLAQNHTVDVGKKFSKIIPGLNEIKSKYHENRPVSYYADMCKMSESNFRKLFREYTGSSPIDYRNEIRIFESKKLVNSGEYTVCEAAYAVGFNNMSFYYDVLKKSKNG